jgi:hypothetical protein
MPRRPGSQQPSPAKELVAAVQQGNVEGALQAAATACLRSPVLLLAVVALLMAAAGLASWLLPPEPLPGMLRHVKMREASELRRMDFCGTASLATGLPITTFMEVS